MANLDHRTDQFGVVDRMKVMVKGGILKVRYRVTMQNSLTITDETFAHLNQDDADMSKLAIKEVRSDHRDRASFPCTD